MTLRDFLGAYSLDVIRLTIYSEDYTTLLDGGIDLRDQEDWKFEELDKLGDKLIKEWFVNIRGNILIKICGGRD